MMKMKSAFESKSSDPSEEYFTKLKDINITTVDSFQASVHIESPNFAWTNWTDYCPYVIMFCIKGVKKA